MSISNVFIKGIGVIMAIVGLILLLATVGLAPIKTPLEWYWTLLLGALFIGAGVVIVRGGTITA